MLAQYLGYADSAGGTNTHLTITYYWPGKKMWDYGLRDFRCFAESWPVGQTLVGSVWGLKNKNPQH